MKYLLFTLSFILLSCGPQDSIDSPSIIIHNAQIFDGKDLSDSSAVAIIGHTIVAIGEDQEILQQKTATTKIIDAKNQFLMPGFIEGHGHFSGMGASLQNLNFLNDTSWNQVIEKVNSKANELKEGEWIYGRGWHQEKWTEVPINAIDGYPSHYSISEITPNNPVLLVHASGHSIFANKKAMELAGINKESNQPAGGRIVKNSNQEPTGIFEENAMDPIRKLYNDQFNSEHKDKQIQKWYEAIDLAQKECLRLGITSFQDAGSKFEELERYEQMAKEGKLDIRLWAMVRHSAEEMQGKLSALKTIGVGNDHFTCNAIKTEVDGALGAYGAWLTEPYADKPGFHGQNTTDIAEIKRIAAMAFENKMQLCIHAIGDRANKEVLDIIESYNSQEEGLRWRVEHAQHLNPSDIQRFKATGAIASMQGVHCTSDAPFVVKRLGQLRAKVGAYAWKALLNQGVTIVNGTDVPVEEADPIKNFFASVTRTRIDNGMTFFVENKMSRKAALKSYTSDAAYASFDEDKKGSIKEGLYADMILINKNLMTCTDQEILDSKILWTMVGGDIKYERNP